ncbi:MULTISPECIES: hypothetical protein [Shewanella]|uniref:Uncharacterized protein n=2 Tax=Shewanella TaxID=22 RepID=A0AAJ1BF67_9GAMM|nr:MULTISPECIES: hypothetical protein [Shewanella]AZQ13260.1 hypothetical protein STH12_04234 [Shewanella khirikhana]MCH4292847.1 hypothetical protein [Shewanella zhuhaiensis]
MNDRIEYHEQKLPMDVAKLILSLSVLITLYFVQIHHESAFGFFVWCACGIYALLSLGSLVYRLSELRGHYRQRG